MPERPAVQAGLAVFGGLLILLALAQLLLTGSITENDLLSRHGLRIVTMGIILISAGLMLYLQPDQHLLWGAVIVLAAVAGASFAGFAIFGSLIALLGGVSGLLAKRPSDPTPSGSTIAFLLSLLGGLLILAAEYLFLIARHSGLRMTEGIPLLAGFLVVCCALPIYARPREKLWGSLVIVMSLLSLIDQAGFLLGFFMAMIGGIVATAGSPAERENPYRSTRRHSTVRRFSLSVSILPLLLLSAPIPAVALSGTVVVMEDAWSQTFTLAPGEWKYVSGNVRAEDIRVTGSLRVQSCCGYSSDDIHFYVSYGHHHDPVLSELVSSSYSLDVTSNENISYAFWNRFEESSPSYHEKTVQVSIREIATTRFGSMAETLVYLYLGGIGIATLLILATTPRKTAVSTTANRITTDRKPLQDMSHD